MLSNLGLLAFACFSPDCIFSVFCCFFLGIILCCSFTLPVNTLTEKPRWLLRV